MSIFAYPDLPFQIETEGVRILARYFENGAVEPSNRTELLLMVQLIRLQELEDRIQNLEEQLKELEAEAAEPTERKTTTRKKPAQSTMQED